MKNSTIVLRENSLISKTREGLGKKKKKGFTLIELIVVIAILGILAAIAIPRFSGIQDDAKDRTDKANANTVQSAIRIYEANEGSLPTGITDLSTFNTKFDDVLPDGVPDIQKSGNHFYYNTGTGAFVCNTSEPTTPATGWVKIK